MLYEIRAVEKVCKVYRVEAKGPKEALKKHARLQSEMVEEFPLSGDCIIDKVSEGSDAA